MNVKKQLFAPAPAPYASGTLQLPNDPLAVAVLAAHYEEGPPTGSRRLLEKSRRLQRLAANARKTRRDRWEDR